MDPTSGQVAQPTPTLKPLGSRDAAAIKRLQLQLAELAALNDLIERIQSSSDTSASSQTLADQLQGFFSAHQVFVGVCEDESCVCRLAAGAPKASPDPLDGTTTAAASVLQETIARGELVVWLKDSTAVAPHGPSGGLLAHHQFADHNHHIIAVVSGPLRDADGILRGAWMVVLDAQSVAANRVAKFLRIAERPVGTALQLIARMERWPVRHVLRAWKATIRTGKVKAWATIIIFAIIVLSLPLTYRPQCDCTVEPVARRFVGVPFDGPLEEALVKPGDEVLAGQLLARMDGREVQWELAGTRADLHRADKERAGHLASHASGLAEVAKFEVNRLRSRTELLEHRDDNLELRSPISGVVVGGDWEDAAGMPLKMGETLFEVAPLDAMVVELAIAEDDYAHVRQGMAVNIRLDAFPLKRLRGTIREVHPRAELRDDENVFIAEVLLDNANAGLRPGMHGTARIVGKRKALGWILFRRPVAALVCWLGW